jgi:DNA polymerase
MFDVELASEIDFDGWRAAARRLRLAGAQPQTVNWRVGQGVRPLFAQEPPGGGESDAFHVPRAFVDLARDVLLHRSPGRFDLLYRLLWRLKDQPRLVEIVSDPDVAEAARLRGAVRQAIHKMHAFVRFRLVEDEPEETYIAWFEPPHRVALAASERFVRRMANLRFSILTPDVAVHWDGAALSTGPGVAKADAPSEDALEDYWRTYYASVFNPARLNPKVMTQHMARQYWRNLPEASLIPELVSQAQGRTEVMVQSSPTQPSLRAAKIASRRSRDEPFDTGVAPENLEMIAAGVQHCRRCDLWKDATQGVPGEGPGRARLMLVGEQPGDQEDLAGHPFVGPAGTLLNRALTEAGVSRGDLYVTNAVRHFKHEMRGKRRLHKTPGAGEVQACRWWLDNERRLVRPKVIVALGATAAKAVLGRPATILKDRGQAGVLEGGAIGFVTVHPSYLLRIPDEAARAAAYGDFVQDLKAAYVLAGEP